MEWFKNPNKTNKNGSIGWKALILEFSLFGSWIAWRIGNGTRVKVGEDPWVGPGEEYRLSDQVIQHLRIHRITFLADVQAQRPHIRGRMGLKTS